MEERTRIGVMIVGPRWVLGLSCWCRTEAKAREWLTTRAADAGTTITETMDGNRAVCADGLHSVEVYGRMDTRDLFDN